MKNTTLVSLLFLLMCVSTLIAQEKENTAHDYLYQATELMPLKKDIKETWLPLPECTDGTHTSHIIAYTRGLLSIIKAGPYADTDPALYSFSPYSIHNYLRRSCTEDIKLHEGLDMVKMRGIALKKDFPDANNCGTKPNETIKRIAAENRIKDHLCIQFDQMKLEDKVLAVKKQLYKNNNPVIVQLHVKQAHKQLTRGEHPVCIVGYDSNRGAFELLGSKAWTDSGYLWLSYEDFGKMALVGYVMAPGEGTLPPMEEELLVDEKLPVEEEKPLVVEGKKPAEKVQPAPTPGKIAPIEKVRPETPVAKSTVKLHGTFEFRFIDENTPANETAFASASPTLNGSTYTLPNWSTDDVYQLLGTTMKAYSYTYVFSMDAEGKTELHFPPLDVELMPDTYSDSNASLFTANKVPLKKTMVPDETAYMVIPEEGSALQSVHPGTDYICVIYSHYELDDITERIVRVHEASQQDFQQRLQEGFGDVLMPNEDIRYTDGLMSFEAVSDRGTAVPVVLEVEVN